jgi:anti-anti-sigma regulatory factor
MSVRGGPESGKPPASGTHLLLVCDTEAAQRARAAGWLEEQLTDGAKVFYKARPRGWDGGDPGWLLGAGGAPRAPRALATGQLEILDFAAVVDVAGGTTAGLHRLLTDEAARGLAEGWPRVAMCQESPGRAMADDAEIAEFTAQEACYDQLGAQWPVTTLCQLTLDWESPAALWETAALHCGGILDTHWGASWAAGHWQLRGELDITAVPRFAAALHGALRARRDAGGDPTLHIDASGIEFFDLACAQTVMLAAHAAARRQLIVVHHGDALRDAIAVVGQPRTLRFTTDRTRDR